MSEEISRGVASFQICSYNKCLILPILLYPKLTYCKHSLAISCWDIENSFLVITSIVTKLIRWFVIYSRLAPETWRYFQKQISLGTRKRTLNTHTEIYITITRSRWPFFSVMLYIVLICLFNIKQFFYHYYIIAYTDVLYIIHFQNFHLGIKNGHFIIFTLFILEYLYLTANLYL